VSGILKKKKQKLDAHPNVQTMSVTLESQGAALFQRKHDRTPKALPMKRRVDIPWPTRVSSMCVSTSPILMPHVAAEVSGIKPAITSVALGPGASCKQSQDSQ